MLRPSHPPLYYMLLSQLILVLSQPWKPLTNDALLVRHQRRSMSPEEADIFDGLESLDASFDILADSHTHGLRPHHQSAAELQSPSSGGSDDHLLSSGIKNPEELFTDSEVETSSNGQPSSSFCRSKLFWLSLLRQLNDDSGSTPETPPSTVEQDVAEGSQYSKLCNSVDASSVQSVCQSHCSQNQDVGSSQGQFRILQFSEPGAKVLKRKHSAPLMHTFFLPEETSVPIDQQYDFGSDAKANPQLSKAGKMKALTEGKTSKDDMASKSGATARQNEFTEKQTAYRNEQAYPHKEAPSTKRAKSQESPYNIHAFNNQDREFLEGLLHAEKKMRLSVLEKFAQQLWPHAKFTGRESFEDMKKSIEKEFGVPEGNLSPFHLDLGKKVGKSLDPFVNATWLEFLENYTQNHCKEMLKCDRKTSMYYRNSKNHLLCARAGAQRLKSLGVFTQINEYFSQMEKSLRNQAMKLVGRPCHLKSRVDRFLIPAREGTISMLYQVELILRLSTPLLQDYEQIHKDFLLEILEYTKDYWKDFKPFDRKPDNKLEEEPPTRKSDSSITLMKKLYETFERYHGEIPHALKISRIFLSQWFLEKHSHNFFFLISDERAKMVSNFFSFLTHCTVNDLMHMIK